jgi:D-alanyl-D-alanine carboxypeptidase/D-alanyl-D-alanine-endopeptidase (penicillin-binding protein 4)
MKSQMKKLLIAAILSAHICSFAQADLAGRIDSIISRSSQKKVRFSINIIKARTGKTVYGHNAIMPLIPASNMKIITTAAALKYLGPNFLYVTKIGLSGDTLVIIAGGDPLLGDRVTDAKYGREAGWLFKDIAAVLKRNGIKAVKDIIIDTSVFDDQRVHPSWPEKDLNRWYACEVCGLNYNDNCIEVNVKNNSGKVLVFIEPKTDFIKIINKVTPIKTGQSKVGSYRTLESNRIVVHGKCNKQAGPFDVAIERPAAFFGFMLAENLTKNGIIVGGQLKEKALFDGSGMKIIALYKTPLTDCLARCNKNSLGLAAEALLKTIAANDSPNKI